MSTETVGLEAKRDQAWAAFAKEHCPPKMPQGYRDALRRAFFAGWVQGALCEVDVIASLREDPS